ncbi:type II secretion system protein [Domibacillus sp. DTU_2020_1001157_1_SI_ALB_TIR_016]|uniref:type II secretion system protein n=1 Tax=Domibacillus sp. DTU_2020_1001157_1_SI_ALB_TIR_016 TaxID=3077789 RepID=UPI0028E3E06D|nr:type II secretion system protein [Domibacillus sp. DTU_2020_1001157_1_SI_ALB_TIR_016]WNS81820.1 type II secretion system protein [Domibacillus sp. DTU_2020_1001157_1_SI_ALB_TIR_016]
MKINEKGYTLIELLAIVVILGIISAIAVVGIGRLIEQSKEKAFVAQALHFKEAAALFVTNERVENPDAIPERVTYKQLYEKGLVEKVIDPFTDKLLDPDENETYVGIRSNGSVYKVCLYGEGKQLCPDTLAGLEEKNIK